MAPIEITIILYSAYTKDLVTQTSHRQPPKKGQKIKALLPKCRLFSGSTVPCTCMSLYYALIIEHVHS